ncbi:MAG: hypothetical protein ACI4SC_06875 [Candidatus Neoclostridium sp.]
MNEQMKDPILRIRRDSILQARKEVKEETNLKKRAALAKERLKMGYWTQLAAERANFLKREGDTPENRLKIQNLQRARFLRENIDCVEGEKVSESERMYLKVCYILDKDEDTTNPIGQLIDYEKYNKMDESAKQRYVLTLVRQYNEMRERYYQERMLKTDKTVG